jgi:hypothetical protein
VNKFKKNIFIRSMRMKKKKTKRVLSGWNKQGSEKKTNSQLSMPILLLLSWTNLLLTLN